METKQLKFILGELQFSADMPPEVLEQLANESTMRELAPGEAVFREGDLNDHIYLVRRGRLALEMKVPGRGAVRILTVGPGEMAGWSSLLGQGKMTASAVVVEEAEVVAARTDKLRELIASNHDFGYHLMQEMAAALSKRLVATRLQLLDLFSDAPAAIPNNPPEGRP